MNIQFTSKCFWTSAGSSGFFLHCWRTRICRSMLKQCGARRTEDCMVMPQLCSQKSYWTGSGLVHGISNQNPSKSKKNNHHLMFGGFWLLLPPSTHYILIRLGATVCIDLGLQTLQWHNCGMDCGKAVLVGLRNPQLYKRHGVPRTCHVEKIWSLICKSSQCPWLPLGYHQCNPIPDCLAANQEGQASSPAFDEGAGEWRHQVTLPGYARLCQGLGVKRIFEYVISMVCTCPIICYIYLVLSKGFPCEAVSIRCTPLRETLWGSWQWTLFQLLQDQHQFWTLCRMAPITPSVFTYMSLPGVCHIPYHSILYQMKLFWVLT